ncbi:SfnB family sulfur acquisition oxidoreductase [Acinetobacter baumannii]|uniref:SfnB family sulfur acquisition oxidoreductase n=1 Tax=Acinetobacter baumannii TaxID=470 RepID=UPI0012983E0E|nr:SfnB family sulfur acquisition oxidoreductase [Acinetobacter baumannii]
MTAIQGVIMSNSLSKTTAYVQVIQNDQQAINAAYQVADFALEGRNTRDQQRLLPQEQIESFSQKGLGGIRIAKKYGGAFVSNKTLAQVFRILSKGDANVGQIPQNQISLLNLIEIMGTEQQKQFIFSEILAGKRLANGGPERNTHDSKTLKTTLTIENGKYILNGEKFYSTGTSFAHWLAIKAIHPEGHVVLVIVNRDAQGIEVINDWNGFGQRTTASGTVKLNRVEVNPELIFDERLLTQVPTYRGAYSQLLQVAIDVGIAEAAFEDTLSTIHKARPIIDANVEKASFEHYTLQEVGKLNILLDAAILLLDEAAEYLDELDQLQTVTDEQVAKASILVAEAKVYANDAALQISEKLLELGGSRSSLSQHNLDQHWRNARVHPLHDPVRWKLHAIGNYSLNGHFPARHAWI